MSPKIFVILFSIISFLLICSTVGSALDLSHPTLDVELIDPGSKLLPNTEYLFMIWSTNEKNTPFWDIFKDEAVDQEITFSVSSGTISEVIPYSFTSTSINSKAAILKKSGNIKAKESYVGYVKFKTPASGSFTVTVTGKEHDTDDYKYVINSDSVIKSFSIESSLSTKEYCARLAEQRAATLSQFKEMYLALIGGDSWDEYSNHKISEAMILSYKFSMETGVTLYQADAPKNAKDAAKEAIKGTYDILNGNIPFVGESLNTFKSILDVGTGMYETFGNLVLYTGTFGKEPFCNRLDVLIDLYGQEADAWRNGDKESLEAILDKEEAILDDKYDSTGGWTSKYSLSYIAADYKRTAEKNNNPGAYGLFYSLEIFAKEDSTKTIEMLKSVADLTFNPNSNNPTSYAPPDDVISYIPSLYTPVDNAIITTVTPAFDWSDFNSPDGKSKQTKYRIRVWEDTGANTEGTKMVLDKEYSGSTSQVTPSRTDYINGGIVDGKNYHWHVQIMNNYGTWSDWANDALDSSNHMDFQVDTNAPKVNNKTPTGTNVAVTTQITVTFSEAMNQVSAQSAFSTSPATSGKFSWSGNTMTYTPSSSLEYSTTYTVTVGTGAKDIAGNNLRSTFGGQFITISTPVPTSPIDSIAPTVIDGTGIPTGSNVPVNTQISVTFSEAMDQASLQSAFSTSPSTTGRFSWSRNTMTYTPSSGLGYGTTYTVNVGTGAKDSAGNSLQSSYRWQFTTTSEPVPASPIDSIAPTVIDGTGIPTGSNIPVNTKISVLFSEEMDQSSVQSAFSTSPSTTGRFSWSGNTMTYTPTSSLGYGTTYTVNVGTGTKDSAGNGLKSSYRWQFTTTSEPVISSPRDSISPTVIDGTPNSDNVPVNTQITVIFSEPMDLVSAQSAFSTTPATTGRFSWSGNAMIYTPSSILGFGTTYTINVGTGAKDLAGNSLESLYKLQFTTTSEPVPTSPIDSKSPTIIDGIPTDSNVPVNTQISVLFSEEMDQGSVQSAFSTSPSTSGRFSWNGNTMTFTPNSNLEYSTRYTISLGTGAKDLDGNSLQAAYKWQFSTELEDDTGSDAGDSSEQTIFEDDFESYETGSYPGSPWQTLFSGNYGYVTDEKAYSGTKSYKSQGMNGWSRNDIVPLDTIDKVGYEIAICPQGQDTQVCLYNREVGSWGSHDANVKFATDGKAYAGDQVILDSYDINQWYLVRVEVDFEKWLMDVYVNGELVATDVSALAEYPTSGGARYNCLNLESLWESDPGVYYDSIKVLRLDEV